MINVKERHDVTTLKTLKVSQTFRVFNRFVEIDEERERETDDHQDGRENRQQEAGGLARLRSGIETAFKVENNKYRNTAKLTFWIFENPLGYTYIWAK